MFFAPTGENRGTRIHREQAAKQICSTCRVLVGCRENVRGLGDVHGIWAGQTETERRDQCRAVTTDRAGSRVTHG
ncbi:WhiB family transcriptional regulator [Rhodococcus sp. 2H158]